jgi:hypothetical protein
MICTLCRSTVPADALVCPECGDLVQARVELGGNLVSSGYAMLWLVLGVIGLFVALVIIASLALGVPIDGGLICASVALLAFVMVPPLLTHGRGRGLLSLLARGKPRYGVRDLTYLTGLRAEVVGSGLRPAINYFATFASLAEFKIEGEQHERLKGCEGQRMVVTYIHETHELVEFMPAPPASGETGKSALP